MVKLNYTIPSCHNLMTVDILDGTKKINLKGWSMLKKSKKSVSQHKAVLKMAASARNLESTMNTRKYNIMSLASCFHLT